MANEKKTPGVDKANAVHEAASKANATPTPAEHASVPPTAPHAATHPAAGATPAGATPAGESTRFDEIKSTDSLNRAGLRTRETGSTAVRANEAVRQRAVEEGADEREVFISGFTFDIYELKNLYANVRDGNYFSAMKDAVAILHKNFFPPAATGRAAASAPAPVRAAEVDETVQRLEEYCGHFEQQYSLHVQRTGKAGSPVGASQEKHIEKISTDGLIAMIRLILNLISEWRNTAGV